MKKITLKEIAQFCDVPFSTVSRPFKDAIEITGS